jgi:hypothetical protein
MTITAAPEVDALLAELRDGIAAILGQRLLGLYLYGSLVAGGFTPGVSDVDLLAVTATTIHQREFALLDEMQTAILARRPDWNDRIEIGYLSAAALRSFRSQASPIAVIHPGEPFHFKQAGRDWLVNWWVVREQGLALLGPPADQLIGPIATQEFLDIVVEHAQRWPEWMQHMRQRKSQSYAILTMCRALYTTEHGRQVSKQQAARWVQSLLPAWAPLIEQALEWRVAPENFDDAEHYPDTLRFVELMRDMVVERARG